MKAQRSLFGHDRVASAIWLFLLMTIVVLLVFSTVEHLKGAGESFSANSSDIESDPFPAPFRILLLLGWGATAIIAAYAHCLRKYAGFLHRFGTFCREVTQADHSQQFQFRDADAPARIQTSFSNLLEKYRIRYQRMGEELKRLRQKLSQV